MWLYLCFIFSAESFTDIIIFYLLVCLSVRLLFSLSCAGSFCLFTFIFPFYWFLFSGVLVFPPGYVDVDSQFACPSTFRCASLYLHVCFVLYLSLVVLSFAFWLYIYTRTQSKGIYIIYSQCSIDYISKNTRHGPEKVHSVRQVQ